MKVWRVPDMWKNSDVWIIGGGPSIIPTFQIPESVVESVRQRKAGLDTYSQYFAPLHSKHVIGINVAYQLGSWVDMCFLGDLNFFDVHRAGLSHFTKLVVTCHEKVGKKELSWVKYLPHEKRVVKDPQESEYGISTRPDRVCWNHNSGAAAISVAAWTGAKRIILVGFDMTLDAVTKEQHFHNEYRKKGTIRQPIQLPFSKHLRPWGIIKRDADNMGIEILNTSLNSAIKEIKKVHIKELL